MRIKFPIQYELEPQSVDTGTSWVVLTLKNIGPEKLTNLDVRLHSMDTYNLGDRDLLIIDARHGAELTRSNRQIKGAVRFSPEGVTSWGPMLPKEKKIVLYCS